MMRVMFRMLFSCREFRFKMLQIKKETPQNKPKTRPLTEIVATRSKKKTIAFFSLRLRKVSKCGIKPTESELSAIKCRKKLVRRKAIKKAAMTGSVPKQNAVHNSRTRPLHLLIKVPSTR